MKLLDQIGGPDGYARIDGLLMKEVRQVQELIDAHLVSQLSPTYAHILNDTPLRFYHSISHQVPHKQLLTRKARILPYSAVTTIKQMSVFEELEYKFGSKFTLADEEKLGRETVWFRLVRPNCPQDVGPLHRDRWFWDVDNIERPESKGLIPVKIWIAICCEVGKAGLRIKPASHLLAYNYSSERGRDGIRRPVFVGPEPETTIPRTRSGEGLAFSLDLLHGGAPSTGVETRVSIEFTCLVPMRVT